MALHHHVDFRVAQTLNDLAVQIGCAREALGALATSGTRAEYYRRHEVPKLNRHRRGQVRVVWEADAWLASIQKSLLRRLDAFFAHELAGYPHPCVHGFVRDRSILTNAEVHAGAFLLLRADIKHFFASITRDNIERRLVQTGMAHEAASCLGALLTVSDVLVEGAHTSPMIANVVCLPMDEALEQLSKAHGCKYTRYADDISISGSTAVPSKSDLVSILERFGFGLASRKYRITKRGQAHFVTGLSIAEPRRPTAPRPFKRRLRQDVYYASKFGVIRHLQRRGYAQIPQVGINSIDGRISFLQGVEPALGGVLRRQWMEVMRRDGLHASWGVGRGGLVSGMSLFVDEARFPSSRGETYAVSVVAIQEPAHARQELEAVESRHQVDPYVVGRKDVLQARRLHFADASQELRTDVVRVIARLPIRAYVGYCLVGDRTESSMYLSLLIPLIRDRLAKYDRFVVTVCCEENSSVLAGDLAHGIDAAYDAVIRTSCQLQRMRPRVTVLGKKAEVCLALPDFALGVFQQYATLSESDADSRTMRFERLREKFRLIWDADARTRYTRKVRFVPWATVGEDRSRT